MALSINLSPKTATICCYIVNFIINSWLIWTIKVVWIKYVSIFHQNVLHDNDKTDYEIIYIARMICCSFNLFLFILESYFLDKIEFSPFYQFLTNISAESRQLPLTTKTLFVIAILSITILQGKIEALGLKKLSIDYQSGHLENEEDNTVAKNVIRVIVIVVSGTICYVMYALSTVSLENVYARLANGWLVPIFTSVVPFTLFITGNENMKRFVLSQFNIETAN